MSVIGLLLFIGIVTNLNDLFSFIPKGEEFRTGFWVVTLVCAAKLFLMISSFPGEIINYSSLYRYNLIFQVGAAILIIICNLIMLPIWGLTGAGLTYFIVIVLHAIVKMVFVGVNFKTHPFLSSHIKLIVISGIIGVLAWVWNPSYHPVLTISIRSFLTAVIFIFLIYRFKISEDINKLIHSTFERLLNIKLTK